MNFCLGCKLCHKIIGTCFCRCKGTLCIYPCNIYIFSIYCCYCIKICRSIIINQLRYTPPTFIINRIYHCCMIPCCSVAHVRCKNKELLSTCCLQKLRLCTDIHIRQQCCHSSRYIFCRSSTLYRTWLRCLFCNGRTIPRRRIYSLYFIIFCLRF